MAKVKKIPVIDPKKCACCRACYYSCPVCVIALDVMKIRNFTRARFPRLADSERCIGCGICEKVCPVIAIEMAEVS
ncbi:MAG: 4Fe-4S binding protein [Oscillospiraceae bacterium]|jgi:NAD-dependent dihydropyrimidine dehydrogenase PreA subunit|nr:4Fe-4S binding protein [Oscillospiraceae bacterium]